MHDDREARTVSAWLSVAESRFFDDLSVMLDRDAPTDADVVRLAVREAGERRGLAWPPGQSASTAEVRGLWWAVYLAPEEATAVRSDAREAGYVAGRRSAMTEVLYVAARALGRADPLAQAAHLISERAAAVVALRELCGSLGVDDFNDDLHLADVIEKRIGRALETQREAIDEAREALHGVDDLLEMFGESRLPDAVRRARAALDRIA